MKALTGFDSAQLDVVWNQVPHTEVIGGPNYVDTYSYNYMDILSVGSDLRWARVCVVPVSVPCVCVCREQRRKVKKRSRTSTFLLAVTCARTREDAVGELDANRDHLDDAHDVPA